MTQSYGTDNCDRLASLGERVRMVFCRQSRTLTGEVLDYSRFIGRDGKEVELPDGAVLRRWGRHYTVRRDPNPNHQKGLSTGIDFIDVVTQDPFPEFLELENSKGMRYGFLEYAFRQRAGFKVVRMSEAKTPVLKSVADTVK